MLWRNCMGRGCVLIQPGDKKITRVSIYCLQLPNGGFIGMMKPVFSQVCTIKEEKQWSWWTKAIPTGWQENNFPSGGAQALEGVTQRGCGMSIHADFRDCSRQVLSDLTELPSKPCFEQGVGPVDVQKSLPTSIIQQFCYFKPPWSQMSLFLPGSSPVFCIRVSNCSASVRQWRRTVHQKDNTFLAVITLACYGTFPLHFRNNKCCYKSSLLFFPYPEPARQHHI